MAKTKTEVNTAPKTEFVKVNGLRREDVAVIVNGEVRVIPMGARNFEVEKRFADEFERAERAKDMVARNSAAMSNEQL